MKPLSLGVDIEEVGRFQKLIRNKRFLSRVFTTEEMTYCFSRKNRAQHFAVRFSAKEAVWKALSEVIDNLPKKLSHKDIGIKNSISGKPRVVLPKALGSIAQRVSISLSHTKSYAVAVAVYKS
jgi:holo-[acyl-carrier protein] synthase